MSSEPNFEQALQEWIQHCNTSKVCLSSSTVPISDCDAYRRIVSMGRDALPFIRQVYDQKPEHLGLQIVQQPGLVRLVQEIVQEFSVPKEMLGRVSEIRQYTKTWLDDYLARV